jgi:hypothetical protein
MATFVIHTATGDIVGVVKAQQDGPPPAVTGDPGYLISAMDIPDDAIVTSGPDSEERIREVFEEFRRERRLS